MVCSQIKIKHYDDFLLTNFNTLRIKSIVKKLWFPENYAEMVTILKKLKDESPIILGNGSNVLFSSQGIDAPIMSTRNVKSVSIFSNTAVSLISSLYTAT